MSDGAFLGHLTAQAVIALIFTLPLFYFFCWALDQIFFRRASKNVRIFLPMVLGYLAFALFAGAGIFLAIFITAVIRTIRYSPHEPAEIDG